MVHAELYYAPGSLKVRLCQRSAELLAQFCGLGYVECGDQ